MECEAQTLAWAIERAAFYLANAVGGLATAWGLRGILGGK